MKKFLKVMSGIMAAASLTALFAGCGNKTPKDPIYTITLDLQNGSEPEQMKIWEGNTINQNFPFKTPKREGWFFDSWYFDAACTQSAIGWSISEDRTVYAGWTDKAVVPETPTALFPCTDLFEVSVEVTPLTSDTVSIAYSVTPKGDFSGAESTESFGMSVSYLWLSTEQFMGEYVSDDIVAMTSVSDINLKKSENYSVTAVSVEHVNGAVDFTSERTKMEIRIFGSPTLQYNHNN